MASLDETEWLSGEFWATASVAEIARHLDAGVGIEARDDRGRTPLLLATMAGNLEAMAYLLGRAADVNARDGDRCTPLHVAVALKTADATELLLTRAYPQVESQDSHDRRPLHIAARYGTTETIWHLIAAGVSTSAQDRDGNTVLHIMARYGTRMQVQIALDAGADATIVNNAGERPLDRVAAGGAEVPKVLAFVSRATSAHRNEGPEALTSRGAR